MNYEAKANYFDKKVASAWAAAEYGPAEISKLARLFEHTGSLIGCKILEPGCGTGRLTEILSDRVGRGGAVVALDISPKMVLKAKARTAARNNVEIHLSPVETFPLERAAYDLILCHQVFPHFEHKGKVLTSLARSLKPEGRLIVIHFINSEEINDRHRKAGTAVEMDRMPGKDQMQLLFENAGLDISFILDDDLGYFLSASRRQKKKQ